ncbi:unnamed protein product [Blepharisma stoltei]|uniref:Transmembrane protein n=1 Tax=Blepharisma stoltei TaxID=1481888 RepID=A0AAU9KFB0_9CILI|nr:unnamed protein product [Blepharisma stoltei]
MSRPDIMAGMPYTALQCNELRHSLLRDMISNDNPNREIRDCVRKELASIKRQGHGYGILLVGSFIAFTYIKAPNAKPHYAGIAIGLSLAYFLGGVFALDVGKPYVLDNIGIIKENPDFEKRRLEIVENCKKY